MENLQFTDRAKLVLKISEEVRKELGLSFIDDICIFKALLSERSKSLTREVLKNKIEELENLLTLILEK